MNPFNLPEVSDAEIVDVFTSMVKANGETTTLDVKNELRAKGYWVTQAQVSTAIWQFTDLSTEFDFRIENNHRVYSLSLTPTLATAGATVPTAVVSSRKTRRTNPVKDWEVSCYTGNFVPDTVYNVTRNQAKYIYSQKYGVPYASVRAIVL